MLHRASRGTTACGASEAREPFEPALDRTLPCPCLALDLQLDQPLLNQCRPSPGVKDAHADKGEVTRSRQPVQGRWGLVLDR